jgi:hypothetical protein
MTSGNGKRVLRPPISRRALFAFFGAWTGGELGVGLVGGDLQGGRHGERLLWKRKKPGKTPGLRQESSRRPDKQSVAGRFVKKHVSC